MKCPSCGAESQGKFCEYCGSEMPQEKSTISITNNYYNSSASQENIEIDNNIGKCPKCGNAKITFKRERVATATQSWLDLHFSASSHYIVIEKAGHETCG